MYVINIAGMNDSVLQQKIQGLPRRCVILFEDVDAAGITRERSMVSSTASQEYAMITRSSGSDIPTSESKINKSQPKPPQRTAVTLSGLLDALNGPGSKEGKRLMVSTKELSQLGKRFGSMVPRNFLTPVEYQEFCMNRRGQPHKALAEFREFMDQKRTGKLAFEYDINLAVPRLIFDEHSEDQAENSNDEDSAAPTTATDSFEEVVAADTESDYLLSATNWRGASEIKPQLTSEDAIQAGRNNEQQLHVAGKRYQASF